MKISKAIGIATTSAVGLGGGTWGTVDLLNKRNERIKREARENKFFSTGGY